MSITDKISALTAIILASVSLSALSTPTLAGSKPEPSISLGCTEHAIDMECPSAKLNGCLTKAQAIHQLSALRGMVAKKFKQRNPKLDHFDLLEIRCVTKMGGSPIGMIVIARGTIKDPSGLDIRVIGFRAKAEYELFGIFQFDVTMTHHNKTLAIFPTKRWWDYRLSITNLSENKVVVAGEGMTYSDQKARYEYKLVW